MKNYLLLLNKKSINLFLSAIIIIFLLIIPSSAFLSFFWNLSALYRILFGTLLYLLFVLLIYVKLYLQRNLVISVKSYIFFLINIIQLTLYLWSFYLIVFSLKTSIYKENLSLFTQYRYLIISVILISVFFYIVLTCFKLFSFKADSFISKITYPYFKEEVRLIMYTWNNAIFSSLCSKLIDTLAKSKLFLYLYLISHFIIFYVSRIIVLLLFTNFVWFDQDLRLVIWMAPILFITWILSFLDYYFQVFFKSHCNYIKAILSAKQIHPVQASLGTIFTSLDNISFNLTSYGVDQGYTAEDLLILSEEWHIAASLAVYFDKYNQFLSYLSRILFIVQACNGFGLVYYFFIKPYYSQVTYAMFSFLFGRSSAVGNNSAKAASRYYAIEATRVRNKVARDYLERQTEGVQSGNHFPLIDRADRNPDCPSEVRYHGQLTHGKGTVANPSVPLHPSKDLMGNPKPQHVIPAKRNPEYYLESHFDSAEIPGSIQYLSSSPAKENLAKHQVQEENT